MRADLRQLRESFCKRVRHDTRFQAAQADPLDPLQLMYRLDQMQQRLPVVHTVGTQMDSGEHHLAVAAFCQRPYLL